MRKRRRRRKTNNIKDLEGEKKEIYFGRRN
jgi:hypothetical protein